MKVKDLNPPDSHQWSPSWEGDLLDMHLATRTTARHERATDTCITLACGTPSRNRPNVQVYCYMFGMPGAVNLDLMDLNSFDSRSTFHMCNKRR